MNRLIKQSLVTLGLITVANTAVAIPNTWTQGFGQGWSEYVIYDNKGNRLIIACNEGWDTETDHSVTFEFKSEDLTRSGKQFQNDELEFLIDGNAYYPGQYPSFTRTGHGLWSDFVDAISKGKSIEVYSNNNKLSAFKPTAQSRKAHAPSSETCPPM